MGKAANLRSRWSGKNHHKLKQALRKPGTRIHYRTTWTKAQTKELEAIEQRKYNPPWCDRIESLVPTFFTNALSWAISIPISIALYLTLLQYWNFPKTEFPKLESYTVIQLANLREKPNNKSKIVCTISKGTIFKSEISPDWKPVKICGKTGYTHKSNLLKTS